MPYIVIHKYQSWINIIVLHCVCASRFFLQRFIPSARTLTDAETKSFISAADDDSDGKIGVDGWYLVSHKKISMWAEMILLVGLRLSWWKWTNTGCAKRDELGDIWDLVCVCVCVWEGGCLSQRIRKHQKTLNALYIYEVREGIVFL